MAILYPAVELLFSVACMLLFVSLLPFLLRLAFGARPLPGGPLREGLEAICRAAGFRCSQLLVLPTGGARMANAFIVGLAAPIRGVFFTDSIVSGMTPDLLECVLAHEIAHSRRRHIPAFFAGMLGFMLLTAAAFDLLEAAKLPTAATASLLLAWGASFWIGVFGWVSRRFESEADLAAARLAPPIEPPPYGAAIKMAEALRRVAELNRIPPWAWSWRHFSIEKRINLLLDARNDPATGEAFEQRCRRWRSAAAGIFVAGLAALGFLSVRAQEGVRERRADYEAQLSIERGEELLDRKEIPGALEKFRSAAKAGADDPELWLKIARCERLLGREDEARRAEDEARKKPAKDPRVRVQLKK
jgi:Zn-dependent protease with chaperone function